MKDDIILKRYDIRPDREKTATLQVNDIDN